MSIQENSTDTYGAYVTGFPNDNMDDILFGKKYNEKALYRMGTQRRLLLQVQVFCRLQHTPRRLVRVWQEQPLGTFLVDRFTLRLEEGELHEERVVHF